MYSIRSVSFVVASVLLAGCIGDSPTSDGSAPQISIDSPADASTVGGSVSIDLRVVDDFGVDKVRVLIDGALLAEMFNPPYHALWNTQALVSPSTHVIKAEATDISGNNSFRQISVTVQNGHQAPPDR